MQNYFTDMTYSCLMVLRSGCVEEHVNQSGCLIKKIGLTRICALELIKIELETLSKYMDLYSATPISEIIRRQIISAMLYVIDTYQFCSVSNQQAILILDFLKKQMDAQDVQSIKQFVMTQIRQKSLFQFDSERTTSALHMGQVVRVAIDLKNIAQ